MLVVLVGRHRAADDAGGIVTFIPINGDVANLRDNDVLGISTEQLLVLNVDEFNSRVRVIRELITL